MHQQSVVLTSLLNQRKQGCRKLFGLLIDMEKVLLHTHHYPEGPGWQPSGSEGQFFFYRLNVLKKGLERFAPIPFCVTLVSGLFRPCVCIRMSNFKGLRICCCWFLMGKRPFIPRSHAYFSYFFVLNYSVLSFGVGFG